MPGKLAGRTRVPSFETEDVVFDAGKQRNVVITATPKFLEMRLKGQRRGPVARISYAALYMRHRMACAGGGE